MLRPLPLLLLMASASALSAQQPTILAQPSESPRRNFSIIYYDEAFLFAGRNYGDHRDFGGNTEAGLFVHSKAKDRWIQITAISTAGGKFGTSKSDNPEDQSKLRVASVGWDFRPYASQPYIEQPLHTSGSIAFPEKVSYDSSTGRYQLGYFTSWGIPSAETVLYVSRADLVKQFERGQ